MNIVFIGTGEIGIPALTALVNHPDHDVLAVVTQPDRPTGRHQKLTPSPIKQEAFKHHLKIFQPDKIKAKASIEQIKYLKPDVIVVAAYGQILTSEILNLPKYGCLNIHASLLPKYRGASPIHAAICEGEKESGVTIMWMDEGLDTGDILLQESTPIRSHDTAEILHDKLAQLGAIGLIKALPLVLNGTAPRIPQDETKSCYAKKLRKEDGRIDWNKPKREIDRHIRGMTPWPGAYTWVPEGKDQRMLKIFQTIISRRAKGAPGEIVRVDKHGILVAAKEGGLLLREVQLEGKKRMPAAEFANGFSLPIGTILE
ncbi:MAG: methionyl-tRNA formyltransferase [Verrucomicrobia bacterium Tous-C9LFEB]|nr:MAG: methionyl-tRNA formyltransferase [Verrucomicrobia bacterium Tous-C9LFEB]